MCERELETEQNCNILTPTLLAITPFLSRSPELLNRGPGGPASLGAGFLYRILPPTRLIPDWLNFLCTELYNSSTPHFLLVGVTNCTHSTHPWSRLYSAIPRPDAPVIYTGAFPILTARPGRRSICNKIFRNEWIFGIKFPMKNGYAVKQIKKTKPKTFSLYTRMLRAILNKSWWQHPTRHQLYGHLHPITKTIR